MSLLRRALIEQRAADMSGFGVASSQIPGPMEQPGWMSWAGVPVDEMRALQQMTVWTCVELTSNTIAQLPVGLFRGTGPTRQPLAKPRLLEEPAAGVSWVEWMAQQTIAAVLRGNAYGYIAARDDLGYATQIETLHPDECRPRRDLGGRVRYKVAGKRELVDPFDIFHVKGLTIPGRRSIEGLNPIGYAAQTIGTALGAEEFGARFFSESANPSGYLTTTEDIDDEEAKQLLEQWVKSHGNRNRSPAVLGSGGKFEPLMMNPDESQFLQTRKALRSEICGFFHTPPHMAGDVERSTSWGTGIEEQYLTWITVGLGIWIVRFESAFSRLFPATEYLKLNLGQLLRGRMLERFQAYTLARQGGWMSIDDILEKEDMPPLPNGAGQDHLQPLNYVAIPPGGFGDQPPPGPAKT